MTTHLEKQFWAFHSENPQVYWAIDKFAQMAVERGYKQFSISMIIERIRWERMMDTTGEPFKIANAHRAYYARLWMQKNPHMPGFFKTTAVLGDKPKNKGYT